MAIKNKYLEDDDVEPAEPTGDEEPTDDEGTADDEEGI